MTKPWFEILIAGIPVCPTCMCPMRGLRFHPVPDGITQVLTDFEWVDTAGHTAPADIPDLTIDARLDPEKAMILREANVYGG